MVESHLFRQGTYKRFVFRPGAGMHEDYGQASYAPVQDAL